eukprot:CAMPEP_0113709682 /NCGR_PEP_ID=MMETSP0038_2-20120614/29715_1 /TAXON_ID=2898 /ORGANISM="Cryptomonas paramecium" /LENGTH=132 /DNA_ID=CAMNT_0000635611 /DNA_START=30 /DNA_END=425 /DNA_ORIENTATION=+ /assembly_acc=CAM_ASM_000170
MAEHYPGIPVSEINFEQVCHEFDTTRNSLDNDTQRRRQSADRQENTARSPKLQRRASPRNSDSSYSSSDDEMDSSPTMHVPSRLLEKDFSKLVVLMIYPDMQCRMRNDLNRYELLHECLRAAESPRPAEGAG